MTKSKEKGGVGRWGRLDRSQYNEGRLVKLKKEYAWWWLDEKAGKVVKLA